MTVLDRVLGRGPQASASLENPQYPLTDVALVDALHIPMQTSSSIRVDEVKSLAMPAVWRAVNLIAGGSAALPLHAYRRDDDDIRVRATSGYAAELLAEPHPDLTVFEFWELVYTHLLLWGNAYLHALRDQNGVIRELWPLHPSRVVPGRASDMTKVYQVDGTSSFSDRQILHIPGFGYDGIAGLSPIRASARQGVGLALAAEQYGAQLFGSGSLAGGILTTEQRLTQPQSDALKRSWKSKLGGINNAHEIAILDSGAKFEKLTIPPEDAQFIESRGFQVEEIARIYGVPPHMLMAVEKTTSWGSGVEQQTIAFVTYTLRPWLTRVEQRLTKILTPGPVYAKYALEGLLRGDSAQRAAYYQTMWNMGVLSTNEIRALEEQPPVEGGNMRYRPLNYGELGTADTGTAAPAETDTEETTDAA